MRRKLQPLSVLVVFLLFLQSFAQPFTPFAKAEESTERSVVLVGSMQSELGHDKDWDPAATATQMNHVGNQLYSYTATIPAGNYEYKIAINGSWDENYGAYGAPGGENIKLELTEETEITFYYHDGTHGVTDSRYYTPLSEEKRPRLVGNIQPAINAGDEWSPDTSTAKLYDHDFDNIYTFTTIVPKGSYEYKVVLGSQWGEEYPGSNAILNVLEDSEITFFFNNETKEVSTNYSLNGADNAIEKDKLYHNTWDNTYRQPFGAIKTGEEVRLRLASKKNDLTRANVEMKNYQSGTSQVVPLVKKATIGDSDFWEASFTPEEKGVYGYKFIAGDGDTVAEYGEDTEQGGEGKAADSNGGLFQLTVYDPAFKTPDWMKESVVYQIFPDRFYNGNSENDEAKTKARGPEPIEHQDWEELPDNPRLQNDAGYDGDGIWSNDFFGGDIKGIQEKLDYIQSLGVNTLYLNPVAKAASNHKYDATDFKAVDPMFGSPEEFKAFTDELASRDMHLILDGVFNHVGDDSIYFDRYNKYDTVGAYEYWSKVYDYMNNDGLSEEEAREKAESDFTKEGQTLSPYGFHLWFNISNEKVKEADSGQEIYKYQAWWGFTSLPEIKSIPGEEVPYDSELNQTSFANYIMYDEDSVAKSWITNGGSGWRLDVANEVDTEFWREFRAELKAASISGDGATLKEGEEPLILGEIWDDASKYFLGDQYDSVMNYRFRGAVETFLKNGNAAQQEASLKAVHEDYPSEAFHALMNLMGSHDTPRAVFLLGGGTDSSERAEYDKGYNYELGKDRLKLAAIFQMGYPGAPTIYYGDEAGVTGSKDPDDRRTYPWGGEDQELVQHYQQVGDVRTKYSNLLAYGDLHHVYADGDVMAYARTNDEQGAIVAINRGETAKTITIDVKDILPNGAAFVDQLDDSYRVTTASGQIQVEIPGMSGRMLIADDKPALPGGVTNITGEASEGAVSLQWSASQTTDVEYVVYKSNLQGAFYEEIGTTTDTHFTAENLTNGKEYYFAIVAKDPSGNLSKKAESKGFVPHYDLTSAWAGNLSDLADATLDLTKTYEIAAQLYIAGATEIGQAEGILTKLQMKKSTEEHWTDTKAVYTGQEGNNNVYKASFTPFEVGVYEYRMAFSSDLGQSWIYTDNTNSVEFIQSDDVTAPADGVTLEQPTKESGQVNLSWNIENVAEDAYMMAIVRNGNIIKKIYDLSKTTYRDYEVSNGKTYGYQVKLFDQAGNTVTSNEVKITPEIVMVEVTFKVHAPDYTPLNTTISMPGSVNGWNTGAWEMSRNGAVTADWEYTTEVQEGTEITYKYVKSNSWDQEGLSDHTPYDKTDDDISLYGYGAPGTDLKVVVKNQGNNRMVVEDKILRWIDRPVVITSPKEGLETEKDSVTVTGNAIKEGVLTINGETVTIADDMSFSHEVQLKQGENKLNIHIEPSEQNKTDIFKSDGGAIGKNTKDYVLNVIRVDKTPPATSIELKQPVQEEGKVSLNWSFEDLDKKDAHSLTLLRNGESYHTIENADAVGYVDENVENGTEYTYQLVLKDQAGNEVKSNSVTVTPKSAVTVVIEEFLLDDTTAEKASELMVELVLSEDYTPKEVKELLLASVVADEMKSATQKQVNEFTDGIQRDLEKLQKELEKKNAKKDKEMDKAEKKVAHNLEKIKMSVNKQ
ncbi:pullulanase X25 domain-containing protein [Rossellomorea aquimaris]|uniref:pullulanase X25 domain-containing protein n=1 Tax=Rossellomorea aquimaris TaxID=189382 RepID=UPI0007D076C3|nr:alpha-amylase family glycosyl hydrolase [Rossellomorea aquimaris]